MSPSQPQFRTGTALLLLLFTATTTSSFVIPRAQQAQVPRSALNMALDDNDEAQKRNPMKQVFGAFGIAATVLSFHAADVPAAMIPSSSSSLAHQESIVMNAPSIQLSAKVTTMDFSMPSSYDAISDAKAKGSEELTVVENLVTGTKRKAVSKSSNDSGIGGTFGKALTEEEKAAINAEREARKEALAAEKSAIAAEKAAEKEALEAQKEAEQKEKAAQQAAEREQKAAEKAIKQAAAKEAAAKEAEAREAKIAAGKFSSADFVDMGLPSYSNSASTDGKKASPFAL